MCNRRTHTYGRVLLLLLAFVISDFVSSRDIPCPPGYSNLCEDDICRKLSTEKRTLPDAISDCAKDGAILATVHSSAINHCLFRHIKGDTRIGLKCDLVNNKRVFSWPDDSPIDYSYVADAACGSDVSYFLTLSVSEKPKDTRWRQTQEAHCIYVCETKVTETGGCPSGYNATCSPERCIKVSTSEARMPTAQAACARDGANLISIHSLQENDCLYDQVLGDTFIGLHCEASGANKTYTWDDGSPADYLDSLATAMCGPKIEFYLLKPYAEWLSTNITQELSYYCETKPDYNNPPATTMKEDGKTHTQLDDTATTASGNDVTLDNVEAQLHRCLDLALTKGNRIDRDDLVYMNDIIGKASTLQGITETEAMLILATMDAQLYANASIIGEDKLFTRRFFETFENLVRSADTSKISYLSGRNFGFVSYSLQRIFNSSHLTFGLADADEVFVEGSRASNSITMTPSEIQDVTASHVFFVIVRSSKLFAAEGSLRVLRQFAHQANLADASSAKPSGDCDRQVILLEKVPVMTASLIRLDLEPSLTLNRNLTLTSTARISVNLETYRNLLHGSFAVSSWDPSQLRWTPSSECESSFSHGSLIAHCPIRSHFTVVSDATPHDPLTCESGLMAFEYMMSILSIVALSVLIYEVPLKSLSCRLLPVLECPTSIPPVRSLYIRTIYLYYIVHSIFENASVSGIFCSTVAVVEYSLIMTSILFVALDVCCTAHALAVGPGDSLFHDLSTRKMLTLFLSVFGIQLIYSLVISTSDDFFSRNDGLCWVRPSHVFPGVVLPVLILFSCLLVSMAVASWKTFRLFSPEINHRMDSIWRQLRSLTILIVQLGLPWILGYFTLYWPKATFWHFAFAFINGAHGVVLLLLHIFCNRRQTVESPGTPREPEVAIVSGAEQIAPIDEEQERSLKSEEAAKSEQMYLFLSRMRFMFQQFAMNPERPNSQRSEN